MLTRLAPPALPCHAHTQPFARCTLAMQSEEPPNQQRRAGPAADAARAAAASARESDEGSNAPGTAGASGSGAAADAAEQPAPAPAPAAAAGPNIVVTAGVHLLSSAAAGNSHAARIVSAGGRDGGWLSSEQVHDLLAHFRQWRLPVSAELKQPPQGKSTSQCGN